MRKEDIKAVLDSVVFLAMVAAGILIIYIRMELYLKFLFLFLCFSSGYFYQLWIKKAKDQFLLRSRDAQRKIGLLMEKAADLDKIGFHPNQAEEDTKLIVSFLRELLDAEKFILWVKKEKEFEVFFAHNISKSLWRTLRANERFVSWIKSLKFPYRIEAILQGIPTGKKGVRLTKSFRHFLEKTGFNWVFPLGYKNEFLGFILLNSPREKMSELENR
jgi:hypothetical protein